MSPLQLAEQQQEQIMTRVMQFAIKRAEERVRVEREEAEAAAKQVCGKIHMHTRTCIHTHMHTRIQHAIRYQACGGARACGARGSRGSELCH